MEKILTIKNRFLALFRIHKKQFVLGGILVLAISVPLVVAQVLKQQDTRQRAGGATPVDLLIDAVQNQYSIGSDVWVGFGLNANTNDVSAIDAYIQFDSTYLVLQEMVPGSSYTEIAWPQNTDTTMNANGIQITRRRIVLVNKTATPLNAQQQHVVKFRFKAQKTGQTTVKFGYLGGPPTGGLTIAASGSTQKIASNNPDVSQTINIVNALTPTPPICSSSSPCPTGFVCTPITPGVGVTPTSYCLPIPSMTLTPSPQYNCNGPTGLWPNGCTCSNDQQCAGGKCAPNGTSSGICTDRLTPTPANNQTDNGGTVTPTPSPTITQIPTVTVAQGETGIKLSLKLPGIGKISGDNATPRRSVRNVKVTVFDNTNAQVGAEHAGTVEYNATNGRFEGNIGLGATFTTGSYTVKVKMDNTLAKRLAGIVAITAGKADNTTPQADLITGDLNQDNSLDVQDFTNVMACFHHESACTGDIAILGDLNDNGITDGDNDDMNILQRNFTNREGD